MATSPIRFTGLASGLDTESIVKALIAPQQAKVDYAVQDKKLLELKKDAWKEMNTKIYSFYTGKLSTLKFNNGFGKTTTTVSNPNIIKIDEGTSIPQGTHEISIHNTAKAANLSTKTVKYMNELGKEEIANKNTTLQQLGYSNGDTINLEVNGERVSVTVADQIVIQNGTETSRAMTITDLEKKMNEALSAKKIKDVNFKFEANVSAFIIGTTQTGSNQSISMSVSSSNGQTTGDKLQNLGIIESSKVGENAKFTYNGSDVFESQTNKIEINGVKFTIMGSSTESITISSIKDTSSQVEFIKEFVNEYNSLIEEINTLVDAPNAKDYRPLTDEQKTAMSETDIKLWEEKIKNSILRKDNTLTSIAESLRNVVGNSKLHTLGVSTGSNYKEKGKLYIDEDKLKEMLDKNPEDVNSILKEVGSKIYDDMKERLKGSKEKSSNFLFADKLLDNNISDVTDKISKLEDKLTSLESSYYTKYAAMEKMMSQLNSQMSIFNQG